MSNQYFQFKQFRIEQEKCAMKVTTDACIQGAWTPVLNNVKRVLDIGMGTGLLSLMLAQRSQDIIIDAIELDTDAAIQARDNIAASPWKYNINVIEGDVCEYSFKHKYDLIISNPPFFKNSLLSDEDNKNMARHTLSLTYEDLLKVMGDNLAEDGYVSVLLPHTEYNEWRKLCAFAGWYGMDELHISHRRGVQAKRVVGLFSKKQNVAGKSHSLVIQDNGCDYTNDFIELLSPFYLNL